MVVSADNVGVWVVITELYVIAIVYAPSSTVALTRPDAPVVPRPNADPPDGVAETLPPESGAPPAESSCTVSVCVPNATVVAALTETLLCVLDRPAYAILTS